jgi:hypothetical protein
MENQRRKPQTLTAEQFEALRARLAQKVKEPPPQPEKFMMGEIVRGVYPELKKLRENGYTLKMLVRMFAEGSVVITTSALATYMKKLLQPREQPRSQAARVDTVASPSVDVRPGRFQMKPDRPL